MKAYLRFCLHLERSPVDVTRSGKCSLQNLYRKMKSEFYVRYNFYALFTVFEMAKQKSDRARFVIPSTSRFSRRALPFSFVN